MRLNIVFSLLLLVNLAFAGVDSITSFLPLTDDQIKHCEYLYANVVLRGTSLNRISSIFVQTNSRIYDRFLATHPKAVAQQELYPCLDLKHNDSSTATCFMMFRPPGSMHDFLIYYSDGSNETLTLSNVFLPPRLVSFVDNDMLILNVHLQHYWQHGLSPEPGERSGEIIFTIEDEDDVEPEEDEVECPLEMGLEYETDKFDPEQEQLTLTVQVLDEVTSIKFKNPVKHRAFSFPTALAVVAALGIVIVVASIGVFLWRRYQRTKGVTNYSQLATEMN